MHCLLAYDLAFMPHGENLILVLRRVHAERVIMKDIGEEVAVMRRPAAAAGRRADPGRRAEPDVKALAIFTDVFDCFLRFLAAVLDGDGVLPRTTSGRRSRTASRDHAGRAPGAADAAAAYDLFAGEFRTRA